MQSPSSSTRGEIRLSGISHVFGSGETPYQALDNVDLTIERGQFVCLLGPSGCGKTTLLNIMAGLLEPTAGNVLIDGEIARGTGNGRSMVFQEYALFPWMSVAENVGFGLETSMPKTQRLAFARRLLAALGMERVADQHPHVLSGGMKQRVSIARALAINPSIVLMDEPFAALDAQTRSILQTDLLHIWESLGKTVAFVTHSIDESLHLADRIVVMRSHPGRIRADIAVDLPRPRDDANPLFNDLRLHIRDLVTPDAEERGLALRGDLAATLMGA